MARFGGVRDRAYGVNGPRRESGNVRSQARRLEPPAESAQEQLRRLAAGAPRSRRHPADTRATLRQATARRVREPFQGSHVDCRGERI
jgi:hypothetical protein